MGGQAAASKAKKQRTETALVKKLRSRAPEDTQYGTDTAAASEEEKAGTLQEDVDDSQEPSDASIGSPLWMGVSRVSRLPLALQVTAVSASPVGLSSSLELIHSSLESSARDKTAHGIQT